MKWLELLTVAGTTLIAAATVVTLYSLGVRLTAIAADAEQTSPGMKRSFAYLCFGLCGLAIMVGLYLIIPYFSK
ncbi:Mg2+ and Co2+ transporter CorA [Arthrobacter ulcerisalmonis]|uniref:hypothetical protein n=1 Tax=Arthrobacter sp. B1I2 TaxID=3042263 RepID=UPI0027842F78|nr:MULTISPECIES: hypothetical protein [Arthrobacter]MDQ0664400.1 Mg2+ and Co2+ transporter CorA [Arthrobacter ulcerisalmonis]MDQ0732310.1 Mg2+ and Co2+ transporter CorA [Arthrobacter sp. B1I2]